MKQGPNEKNQLPEWLRQIQLNSWEAELLVSAIVLYALFEVPGYLRSFVHDNISYNNLIYIFTEMTTEALGLLRLGFMIHIIVRGFWIAMVGLSYVFPSGVKSEHLKYKGRFKREIESNESLIGNVLWLEKVASLIYGIFFMFLWDIPGPRSTLFGDCQSYQCAQ